ncbi:MULTISPECIES: hypothetical protein [unclassified Brevundimonas]|uniref:hypothetical protein n=1 Tax=unclassified Brevundimonas TaxID=2622653 RepID=UPI0025BF521A|nr:MULTISPECIES: hypothetical protein [unclassified Brevundimonas]
MARYNKIYAGPATQVTPQVRELPAAASTVPGSLVVVTAGKFALAGATTVGKVWVAQDNHLAGKGVDDAIAANDVLVGMELLDEQFFNVRVATGNNLSIGTPLTPAADGALAIAVTSDLVVAYSEEAFNNTSGSAQLVRVRAATGGHLTAAA